MIRSLAFLPLLILSTLFTTPAFSAPDENSFCLQNRLFTSATAVLRNLRLGLVIRSGGQQIYPKKGIHHLRWGKSFCRPVGSAGDERIYLFEQYPGKKWELEKLVETRYLKGMTLRAGRAGIIDQVYGWNYIYEPSRSNLPSKSRWMNELYTNKDTPINQICMPGSHDTGSYDITLFSAQDPHMDKEVKAVFDKLKYTGLSLPIKEIISAWGITQLDTTYKQLAAGARYLDIRARMINGKLETVHQLVGASMVDVVTDLRKFLEVNTGEVVIFHIQETHGMTTENRQAMYQLLRKELGSKMASPDMGAQVSIADMHSAGKQVIVVASQYWDDSLVWSWNRYLRNTWHDQNRPEFLLEQMAGSIAYRSNSQFNVSQMILTARDKDLMYMAAPGFPTHLRELNGLIRSPGGMTKYLQNVAESQGKRVNIILQDFLGESDVFATCMAENLRYLNKL